MRRGGWGVGGGVRGGVGKEREGRRREREEGSDEGRRKQAGEVRGRDSAVEREARRLSERGDGGGGGPEAALRGGRIAVGPAAGSAREEPSEGDADADTAGELVGKEVHRWGEARNPGPQDSSAAGMSEDVPTVEEAWRRAQEDPNWVPAWKTWSRQRVIGNDGAKLRIVLESPTGMGEEGVDGQNEAWEEEELETFLQKCEVEAGWRDHVEVEEGQRLAREWRSWEAELTMAGISGPCIEECRVRVPARGEQEEVEVVGAPPPVPQLGKKGRTHGGEERRRGRRRWTPMDLDRETEGPRLELGEGHAAVRPVGEEAQQAEFMTPPADGGARRTSLVRPRGRRQSGGPPEAYDVELVSFNGSGAPQALEAMGALDGRRKHLGALLVQEHHAKGGAIADLQAGAKARGFKFLANEATGGKGGGASAGVGVAVPTQRGYGGIFGPNWDFSPVESPGRLAGTWLQAGPRGGMIVLSIYCWPTEGMTLRNVRLVEKALEVVASSGCAWAIAGDFNATPSELVSAADRLLDRAGGVVRAPQQPTCYPAMGKARTLDDFILDTRIAAAASQAEVDEVVVGSPHRAVRIKLRGRDVGGLVQMVKKPRMFPRERPVGCARRPLVPREAEGANEGGLANSVDEEWRRLAYCVEGELCRQCDLVGEDGAPNKGYLGRGEGIKLVRRPMMAPRSMARHGRADAQLHRLAWTLNRLEELIHLAARRGEGWGEDSRHRQWERVVSALGKENGCTRKLADLDETWAPLLAFTTSLRGRPQQEGEALKAWATRAREAIDRRKHAVAEDRRKGWRVWVAGQIRRGEERSTPSQSEPLNGLRLPW